MLQETDVWDDDRLGRKDDAGLLYELTNNRYLENKAAGKKGAYVINVDAMWGQGKTFLLSRMHKQIIAAGHPAVFINAWEHDYIDDPYTLTVAAIDAYIKSTVAVDDEYGAGEADDKKKQIKQALGKFRRNFGKIAAVVGTELTKTAAKRLIGSGVETVAELVTGDEVASEGLTKDVADDVTKSLSDVSDAAIDKFAKARIDDVNETKESVENFKSGLESLLKIIDETEKHLPFYIFIDELDRCKPTYAVAMLERIKHLFDVTGIVFILATDTDQLAHSIGNVYGSNFDSKHYLQRFFNRSYQLPDTDPYLIALDILKKRYLGTKKWNLPLSNEIDQDLTYAAFLAKTSNVFKLTPRQFEQSVDILQDITTVWPSTFNIELIVMYPMICQYAKDRKISEGSIDIVEVTVRNANWSTSRDFYDGINFNDYFPIYRELWPVTLKKWMNDQMHSQTRTMEANYVYENMRHELNSVGPNIVKATYMSAITKYGAIIMNNRTYFYE